MKLSMHSLAADSFAPMLDSLAACLEKGFAEKGAAVDLVNARLAPDMFTLAQQVQQACHYATDGMARLTGSSPVKMVSAATTAAGLKIQIADALDAVRSVPADAFDGAEARDCSIEIPGDKVIEMNGVRYLKSWALPHFYFHVVTAYDILRHCGVGIGKSDYLSQVGGFIRPRAEPLGSR